MQTTPQLLFFPLTLGGLFCHNSSGGPLEYDVPRKLSSNRQSLTGKGSREWEQSSPVILIKWDRKSSMRTSPTNQEKKNPQVSQVCLDLIISISSFDHVMSTIMCMTARFRWLDIALLLYVRSISNSLIYLTLVSVILLGLFFSSRPSILQVVIFKNSRILQINEK